ncbi:Rtr1/RPAP2 family-domain-containing protein [Amylocarpus encephaloides]|uniref:RNA polymerase II subunit B1 CTD phosphatase RPAP2 homolog n=1 Tax=Amylocarpus encephaloides TaxID=45428 RepID=A0A9P7YCF6_9HELO|nr:Rtr1/RPAP2 family-domain-containing protein [Amylocarpus encephaloides]
MATEVAPKSILKKPTNPTTASTSKADRDRQTALYHADLIQARKDTELEILSATEELLEYPLAKSPFNASNPSPDDAKTFKSLLTPFQPRDYDELIVERNCADLCGYAMCPNPRQRESGGGIYRVMGTSGKAKDFKILAKEELEKWCSEACAKRALYIRVQLSESPSWERGATEYLVRLDLLDEPKSVEALEKLDLSAEESQNSQQNKANLALERGDQTISVRSRLVDVKIEEKVIQRKAEAPSLEEDGLGGKLSTMHLALEGHVPIFDGRKQVGSGDSEDEDTDWKL